MDLNTILPLVLAIVAIVPGVWALVNQASKDKNQAKIDMNTATISIIAPLQAEVGRLQTRIIELEKLVINKTTEIGKLMEEGIDKDSEIRTMKYQMMEIQGKLDTMYNSRKKTKSKTEEEIIASTNLEEELKTNEAKKEEVRGYTSKLVTEIQKNSISNGHSGSIEPEKE